MVESGHDADGRRSQRQQCPAHSVVPLMTTPEIDIAVLKTEVAFLKDHIAEIRSDTREIKETLTQAKGGWKTLMLVAGVASTIGALLAKFIPFLSIFPR